LTDMRVVESSGDVDAVCEPPRATLPRGLAFPAPARRTLVPMPAALAQATTAEEGPERDAERMMAAMSEAEIAEAQAEILRSAGARTLAILERRAAKKAADGVAAPSEPVPSEQKTEAFTFPQMERELLLPPIEHDKLAWTDPDTKAQPRERERDVAQSLRAQSLRFGLRGQVLGPEAAGPETYGAGLHHHGEEPERAGYTLEELATLMRSHNEPQNVFAVQLIGQIASRIAAGGLAGERLYPEAGERSMSVGEGVLWEMLGLRLLVACRLCFQKRSPALREACRRTLAALIAAYADESGLGSHAAEPHWGAVVFPTAPLFEDDGSEEMEMRDGLRSMVRQLDVLPLLDPAAEWGLECLCLVAAHSRPLALLVAQQPALVAGASGAAGGSSISPSHAAAGLKLLRLVLAASSDHIRLLGQAGAIEAAWRHLLVPAGEMPQREAALLLRMLLLWNSQVESLLDRLPELLRRCASGSIPVRLVALMCDAAVARAVALRGAESAGALLGGALGSMAQMAAGKAEEADAAAVLHMAATLARQCRGIDSLRSKVSLLFGALENATVSGPLLLGFARLVNACEDVRAKVPSRILGEALYASLHLSPPQVWQDGTNRFQTQRRTRVLVAERGKLLLARELLIFGKCFAETPLAALGAAVDLASRLVLAGCDEFLFLDFAETVLFSPALAERAARELHGGEEKNYDAEDARRQSERMCASSLRGVSQLLRADESWIARCRAMVGEGEAKKQFPRANICETFFAAGTDSFTLSTLLGADFLFTLARNDDAAIARAATQFLFLAESSQKSLALLQLSPFGKIVKLCGLFSANSFEDPAVAAALVALLSFYGGKVSGEESVIWAEAENCNPLQAATDLLAHFLAHGSRSAVFSAFIFFFFRSDLPHDLRLLLWTGLSPAWRLLNLEHCAAQSCHMCPHEEQPAVRAAMETALRSGGLTERSCPLLFFLAVHHLSFFSFRSAAPEWTRLQLLRRLRETPAAFSAVISYEEGSSVFPPRSEQLRVTPERAALVAKLDL
jgi:hypothetical protein